MGNENPAPGSLVQVKPLVWTEELKGFWWTADAYRIEPFDGGGFAVRVKGHQSGALRTLAHGISFERAQEIAQADHDEYIRSRLSTPDAKLHLRGNKK